MIDLGPLLQRVERVLARHALGEPGVYARFTGREGPGERPPGPNAYGSADAANLLYTLDRPIPSAERAAWLEALGAFQDARTGLFHEATHDPVHTTAHCVAALELLDARAPHPLRALAPLRDPSALERFLEALDWRGEPWSEAHRGAGLYAALVIAGDVGADWEARYFDWLAREVDPETGLLRRGCHAGLARGDGSLFPHLAGSFHYLFNFEHRDRPWPHPEALIDTCLAIRAGGAFPLARLVWFADVDWVYCLTRCLRRCDHRREEALAVLRDFAAEYVAFLESLDPDTHEGLDDLHRLFGAVCALAELQQTLPDELRSEPPLRLVLDRRPFI